MLSIASCESAEPAPPRAKYLPPRFTALLRDVAAAFHLEPADVLERTRLKSRAAARHIVMWAIRKTWAPQPSFPEIGEMFDRDHTTVMAAVKRIDLEIGKKSPLGQMALKIAGAPPVLRLVAGAGAVDQLEFEFGRKRA